MNEIKAKAIDGASVQVQCGAQAHIKPTTEDKKESFERLGMSAQSSSSWTTATSTRRLEELGDFDAELKLALSFTRQRFEE
jgi:hypothetical protein